MPSKLALREEDYLKIEEACQIQGHEPYVVVYMPLRNKLVRSIHVFERKPDAKELTEYENNASKLKFKGNKAEIEGGAVAAAAELYRRTISRVYDIVVDRQIVSGPIERNKALELVEPLVKREAVADLVGQVFRSSRIDEMEGDEKETATAQPSGF